MTVPWTLHDLSSVMPDYVFDTNPNTMTSPLPVRVLESHGRAIDGEFRAKGSVPPHDWTFGGVLFIQTQHDALRDYVAKAGQVYLTDHLGRTFVVRLKLFNPTRAWTPRFPWRHKYTCNVTTYGGPL